MTMTSSKFEKPAEERIADALDVARRSPADYVVDQMARALFGCPETYLGTFGVNDAYEAWKAGQTVATPD